MSSFCEGGYSYRLCIYLFFVQSCITAADNSYNQFVGILLLSQSWTRLTHEEILSASTLSAGMMHSILRISRMCWKHVTPACSFKVAVIDNDPFCYGVQSDLHLIN